MVRVVIFTAVFVLACSRPGYAASSLTCYYYKLYQDREKDTEAFGTWEGDWLFARDKTGSFVSVPGNLEDGFWVANMTSPQAQSNCIDAIKLEKGEDYKLLKMTVGGQFLEDSIDFSNSEGRVVVFGDSLSDEGNLKKWVPVYPVKSFFMGRYSNGPIWTDYLRSTANVGVLNWAFAGSTSAPTESWIDVRSWVTSHLKRYVSAYLAMFEPFDIAAPDKDVFLFWAGGNDIFQQRDLEAAVASIGESIRMIARAGGKQFAVVNLFDCMHMPYSGCGELDLKYNRLLKQEIDRLQNLPIKVAYIDLHDGHNRIMKKQSPSLFEAKEEVFDYGLIDEKDSYGYRYPCFKGRWNKDIQNPGESTCLEVRKTFFYDSAHPSTFGHCWLTLFIHEGLYRAGFVTSKPDMNVYENACENLSVYTEKILK